MGGVGRRGLLIAGVGALAGCSGSSTGGSASGSTVRGGTSAPTPTAAKGGASAGASSSTATVPGPTARPGTPTVGLPSVRLWAPGAGEIEPAAKRVAVAAVQDLLRPGGTRGAVEVIDAQYGGILSD
ncbi:MAG TPA: hypothetical protein VFH76_32975, partial [Kribbella sp.]|nr:hypothetical protein [Kribbella sp.]